MSVFEFFRCNASRQFLYYLDLNCIFTLLIFIVRSGPVVFDKEPESSSTGIRLSWKPILKTFWNGEEITFQVDVLSVDYTLVKSYPTKKNSAIISGLFPATVYIVNITGRTVFGPIENRTENVTTTQGKLFNNVRKFLTLHDFFS